MKLKPSSLLFIYNAIEMYPNTPTDKCCERLERWFKLSNQRKWFKEVKSKTLMDASKMVMKEKSMKFGDLFVKHIKWVAIGMSPAPPITNVFVVVFKEENVVDKLNDCIDSLKRFIENCIGTWDHDPDPVIDGATWI